MSLLSIERASVTCRRGHREHLALRDLSMTVQAAELTVVLGPHRPERGALCRLAAGAQRPAGGRVLFEGSDLRARPQWVGRRLVLCSDSFNPLAGETALDHVAVGLLAQRHSLRQARHAAKHALEKMEAADCGLTRPADLDRSDLVRVSIARALAVAPRLLVLDDLTSELGVIEGDRIRRLLRGIVEDGIAVLICTADAACVPGSDRALLFDGGRIRGEARRPLAEVVPLRPGLAPRRTAGQAGDAAR